MQSIAHAHPLAPQQFISDLYCDICGRQGGDGRGICYSCPSCNIDICQGCYNQLKMITTNWHNHRLLLAKRNFKCNECGMFYEYKDSMYCESCDYDICMRCYISL